LVAVFAALYYALSLVSPYVPAVGIPDLRIKLEALMASVFGLILGPYLGALTAFTGASVTWALPPASANPFDAPFLLSPPINALVVGLIFYKKWKWGSVILGVLIAAFLFLPPSQPISENYLVAIAVLWDKVIALFLVFPTLWLSRKNPNPGYIPIMLFLVTFIGNQADNMWGADIFAVPFVYEGIFGILDVGQVRLLFMLSPFIYPAIRLVQATLATAIAVPLLRALKGTKWLIDERSIIEH
jgi:hypothetical protein